ncbi:hypothetical protein B9Q02_06850 [Candidatus Marsarchaeota G1 archaeon BE_D]|jgi:ATPases involved in chromosome partitioning|uniref:Iron-sulfur cluster carrier protein n=1 Tax=Candidatus Marsarchaeota G1 archaeon BE_D TaxID=1978156 RepID=A0A2R6AG01_9ARCH|nr:MAG: hypothetical protein B9Q02_06850 [Candidatus Marsarchaeota G1 archaeon BE_D]
MSKSAIIEILKRVYDPEIGENIVDLDMVKEVKVDEKNGFVKIKIALTVPECPLTQKIKKDVSSSLESLGIKKVEIEFTSMSQEERQALLEKLRSLRARREPTQAESGKRAYQGSPVALLPKGGIHNIIAVVSGKGGVGKSTISALIAVELKRRGFRVGVMDADVTGPSIPKLFGLTQRLEVNKDGNKLLPATTKSGIKVVSMNLILNEQTEAAIWRGPIVSGVIRQFFTDVEWGELDYLVVDLPPGTSDAPLTVFQSIPLDGVIVVTSPQELARVIVAKAVNMAKKLNAPLLGLVENMAYTKCTECGSTIFIFGKPKGEEAAKEYAVPYLGELPLDPLLVELCDSGRIEEYQATELSRVVDRIGEVRVELYQLKAPKVR